MRQGFGDFHHLLACHGQLTDAAGRLQREFEAFEQRCGVGIELRFVQQQAAEFAGLASQKNILRGRQVAHQVQFLVHDANGQRLGVGRAFDVHRFAVEQDLAAVFAVDPGQDFHQRGFARAVFTHECVHLAGLQVKLGFVQRAHARE